MIANSTRLHSRQTDAFQKIWRGSANLGWFRWILSGIWYPGFWLLGIQNAIFRIFAIWEFFPNESEPNNLLFLEFGDIIPSSAFHLIPRWKYTVLEITFWCAKSFMNSRVTKFTAIIIDDAKQMLVSYLTNVANYWKFIFKTMYMIYSWTSYARNSILFTKSFSPYSTTR